jgi:hypothetical protein
VKTHLAVGYLAIAWSVFVFEGFAPAASPPQSDAASVAHIAGGRAGRRAMEPADDDGR